VEAQHLVAERDHKLELMRVGDEGMGDVEGFPQRNGPLGQMSSCLTWFRIALQQGLGVVVDAENHPAALGFLETAD